MSRHVLRHPGAQPTTVKCPECGDIVVYKGNFFCNSQRSVTYSKKTVGAVILRGTCTWELPDVFHRETDRYVREELYERGYITD